MFRSLIFNRREEIIFIKDHPTFEESLKDLNIEIDERKGVPLSGAYIYKYLNPEQNQSMAMVASLRTTR
jgi:hypothetical protein